MRLLEKSKYNAGRVSDLVCSRLVDLLMANESKFYRFTFSSLLSEPRVLKDIFDVDSASLFFVKHLEQQVFALVAD